MNRRNKWQSDASRIAELRRALVGDSLERKAELKELEKLLRRKLEADDDR